MQRLIENVTFPTIRPSSIVVRALISKTRGLASCRLVTTTTKTKTDRNNGKCAKMTMIMRIQNADTTTRSFQASSSQTKEAALGTSMRIVPGPPSQTSVSLNATEHPVHKGVHDAMRFGPRSLAHETSASATQHPLQHRLEQWDETRDNFKLTTMRNIYGIGAPVRTLMERRIVGHVSCSLMSLIMQVEMEYKQR